VDNSLASGPHPSLPHPVFLVTPISALTSSTAPPRDARSPEEAARQFEAVLVRQFVEVMTKDLFDSESEGMLTGQADLQRDTLTDTLTDHLVESGTFGIAELMIQQWKKLGRIAPGATEEPLFSDPSALTALSAQGRPPFIDNPSDIQP
jgi:flagellar protein FlgJ